MIVAAQQYSVLVLGVDTQLAEKGVVLIELACLRDPPPDVGPQALQQAEQEIWGAKSHARRLSHCSRAPTWLKMQLHQAEKLTEG
jgi:hypothetical protein